MKRLLTLAASLALTAALALIIAPLAAGKGAPPNRGCPHGFELIPSSEWYLLDAPDAAAASDTNGDDFICLKPEFRSRALGLETKLSL